MKLILLLKPEGTLQLLHAGQAVLFNALTAHAARDVLSAPDDAMTPRALSGVTRTGRLAAKHLDSLSRLQGRFAAAARPAAKAPPEKTPANAPELRPDEPAAVQESAAPATEAFFPRHPRPRAGDRSRCGAGSGPRDEPYGGPTSA
jgi:hypothetical protein